MVSKTTTKTTMVTFHQTFNEQIKIVIWVVSEGTHKWLRRGRVEWWWWWWSEGYQLLAATITETLPAQGHTIRMLELGTVVSKSKLKSPTTQCLSCHVRTNLHKNFRKRQKQEKASRITVVMDTWRIFFLRDQGECFLTWQNWSTDMKSEGRGKVFPFWKAYYLKAALGLNCS